VINISKRFLQKSLLFFILVISRRHVEITPSPLHHPHQLSTRQMHPTISLHHPRHQLLLIHLVIIHLLGLRRHHFNSQYIPISQISRLPLADSLFIWISKHRNKLNYDILPFLDRRINILQFILNLLYVIGLFRNQCISLGHNLQTISNCVE
jgi:hypothetical protein